MARDAERMFDDFSQASRWHSLGTIAGHLPPVRIEALFV